jgi:hypothetical protein
VTKANEFMKALQAARPGSVETVDQAWNRQKSAWLLDVEALRASVRRWLGPVLEARLATVADKDFPIAEPDLGQYIAPGLEITLVVAGETRVVLLRPRGMRVVGVVETGRARAIGASGRVDLECGVAREILLRFKGDEQAIWVSFSKGEKRTLDEDVFFELLAQVTELKLR